MLESGLLLGVLSLIGVCLVVLTATAVALARELHRTLQKANAFLGASEHLVREARQITTGARRIVARADRATGRVEQLVSKAVGAVAHTLEQFRWFGNGARSEPRLRYRHEGKE